MTEPLPWTGAKRSMQEIEQQKPSMETWFENQKQLSLDRVAKRRSKLGICGRNKGTGYETISDIFNGLFPSGAC